MKDNFWVLIEKFVVNIIVIKEVGFVLLEDFMCE